MKVAIILVLFCSTLLSQVERKVIVWDNNLNFLGELNGIDSVDIFNTINYSKLIDTTLPTSENPKLAVYLIYFGDKIKNGKDYKFSYNPLSINNRPNYYFLFPSRQSDSYLIDNMSFPLYNNNCEPQVDSLADGLWLELSGNAERFFIAHSKDVCDCTLSGYYRTYSAIDSRMVKEQFFRKGYPIYEYWLDDENKNDTLSKTLYNKCGVVEYQFYHDKEGRVSHYFDSKAGIDIWFMDNRVSILGYLKDSLPHGEYKYYDSRGTVVKKVFYKKGRAVKIWRKS